MPVAVDDEVLTGTGEKYLQLPIHSLGIQCSITNYLIAFILRLILRENNYQSVTLLHTMYLISLFLNKCKTNVCQIVKK